jgi:hypothetical protein
MEAVDMVHGRCQAGKGLRGHFADSKTCRLLFDLLHLPAWTLPARDEISTIREDAF